MATTNLGRVQGGGMFYSTTSSGTSILSSTLMPDTISGLTGDHIIFSNGDLRQINTVSNGTISCSEVITNITGATGATGSQGVSITDIEKTGTSGLVDTYTITFVNGTNTTFTVTNGQDGIDGVNATTTSVSNSTANGLMSSEDKTKLDGIEESANNYTLPSDVVQDNSYVHTENNYTSTEKTKLSGIAAGAQVNTVSSVNTKTGAVVLATSDLENDSSYITKSVSNLDNYDLSSAVDTKIANAVGSLYKYMGSVDTYVDLPDMDLSIGDTYNVVAPYEDYNAGTNFAWNGTRWDALGGSIDLSNYYTTSQTDAKFVEVEEGKGLSTNDYTSTEKGKLEGIEAGAQANTVSLSDIPIVIDNTESTSITAALSANQGNVLNTKITALDIYATSTVKGMVRINSYTDADGKLVVDILTED